METFQNNDKNYITINGKSFFLIRGYERGQRLVFIQVIGNYSLFKEDLPDTKKWDLVRSKSGSRIVYTAFLKDYHNYGSDKSSGYLYFPAHTEQGSFYMLIKFANEKYGINFNESNLIKIKPQTIWPTIETAHDMGNCGNSIYVLKINDKAKDDFELLERRN